MKLQMEVVMISKVTAAIVAAVLVASAGVASAQTSERTARTHAQTALTSAAWQSPHFYYNKDYWDGVAPAGRIQQRDPFAGTYFEGVVPY